MQIGFFGLLGLLLVAAKIFGTITLGWFSILMIAMTPVVLAIIFILLFVLLAAFANNDRTLP